MEKVLITGGAGYLGSIVTGHLLEKGHHVTCLDNLMYNQNSLLPYTSNQNFNFVFGDVRDKSLVGKTMEDASTIIPLAAIVGMPACKERPFDALSINTDAVKMLNELRTPNQKLIYPTTNSGYGTKSGDLICTEETPLNPISLYGTTKAEAEKSILESGKDAITLRLATVFGVSLRMRTDLLVNDFVWKAMQDGYIILYEADFKRNYVHIKDVARCFSHCIENFNEMKNQVYNVGLDEANLSKRELAEKVKEYIPKFIIHEDEVGKDPDKRNYIVSNEKIKKAGFTANNSIDFGIKELMKAYSIILKTAGLKNA